MPRPRSLEMVYHAQHAAADHAGAVHKAAPLVQRRHLLHHPAGNVWVCRAPTELRVRVRENWGNESAFASANASKGL